MNEMSQCRIWSVDLIIVDVAAPMCYESCISTASSTEVYWASLTRPNELVMSDHEVDAAVSLYVSPPMTASSRI